MRGLWRRGTNILPFFYVVRVNNLSDVTSIDCLEHAKRWLERAIFHLKNGKEEDAKMCIRYAGVDEKKAVEKLEKKA